MTEAKQDRKIASVEDELELVKKESLEKDRKLKEQEKRIERLEKQMQKLLESKN